MDNEVPESVRRAMEEINEALGGTVPRYRYWESGNRTFEYTTERCRGLHGEPEGFWAVERLWKGPKGRRRGVIRRSVRFVQRKKAKARAYAWYQKDAAQRAKRAEARSTK